MVMISLVSILIMSATTWMQPQGPTRLGPRRHWKAAQTFRSARIRMSAMMAYKAKSTMPISTHSTVMAAAGLMTLLKPWSIQEVTTLKSNISYCA